MRSLNIAMGVMVVWMLAIAGTLLFGLPHLTLGLSLIYIGCGLIALGIVSAWWPTMLEQLESPSYSWRNVLFIFLLWPTLWYAVSTHFVRNGHVVNEAGQPIWS